MTRTRKDDHLHYARTLTTFNDSDFNQIKLIHQSIPKYNLTDIDLSTSFAKQQFKLPLYINAMTGGSRNGQILNQKLAIIAKELNLPMALGSASITLKDKETLKSFTIARKENPNGFLMANLGVEHPLEHFQAVIESLEANAIQVHLNVMQELLMPEGDKEFNHWQENLANLLAKIDIPIIIKEVGFGMSQETLKTLVNLGAKTIDVSGTGGTNFAAIENARSSQPKEEFNHWGLSTPISLLESITVQDQVEILASGGINTPLKAIKSLALGAKSVGLAGYVLNELSHHNVETTIQHLQTFIDDLKIAMVALNAKNMTELKAVPIVLHPNLLSWCKQRQIPYSRPIIN